MKNPWLPVADLLSGFVVVVLLLFVTSVITGEVRRAEALAAAKSAEQAEEERRVATMAAIAEKLSEFEQQGLLHVDVEKRLIELSELSFSSGSACLRGEAIAAVEKISAQVLGELQEDPYLNLYIEGHTDPVPVNSLRNACGYFANNTQLSTLRAANVKTTLLGAGADAYRPRVSVSGWGSDKLRNTVVRNAPENRRVEVRFVWGAASSGSSDNP